MEQDDEPTVLEYARHHGLANAHLQHHALSDAFLNHKDAELNGLEDDPWLFKIEDHATYSPDTRLQVDGSVTHFLAAITNPPSEACQFDEECQVLTNPRRSLKQELPLLRTDHEEDLRQFVKPFDPSLADEHLPLEGLDDELDEGLGWPSSCFGVSKRIEQECWAEKLVVSRKVLPYLDEIMGIQPTEEIPTFDDQHLPLYKGVCEESCSALFYAELTGDAEEGSGPCNPTTASSIMATLTISTVFYHGPSRVPF